MKTFIILALIVNTSVFASTNAKTIEANSAMQMHSALVSAGAEVESRVETSFIEVKDLNCSTEGGFVLLPLTCRFIDSNSTQEITVRGDKAVQLRKALLGAGIKEVSFRAGERSSSSVSAKNIMCSTTEFRRYFVSCTIK